MKRITMLTLTVLLVVMFASCAGSPQQKQQQNPINHQLEISVNSETPAGLEIKEKDPIDPIDRLNGENKNDGKSKLSGLSFIAGNKLYSFIYSGLSVTDVVNFRKDIIRVRETTDISDMELFINSPGGDAFQGLSLADLINDLQSEGWTVTAFASGIVASAAVPIFATCKPRYATRGTIFMVHEAALWKWPGRESASAIRSQNELMIQLQERYIQHLVENSNLKKDEWIEKEGATTWFSTEQAIEWGIVDEAR